MVQYSVHRMAQKFLQQMAQKPSLTIEDQQKAGTPIPGTIGDEHKDFLETLIRMIDSGELVIDNPRSFLKLDVYDALEEDWKDKTDLALLNLVNQIRLVYAFYKDSSYTNESAQLHTMVEQLWQQKQAIEQYHDVFKF